MAERDRPGFAHAPIEGVGIVPDVPVRWTVQAFRAGEDPDMAAAEQLVTRQIGGG